MKKQGRVCIVTHQYPPGNWGGLARTVFQVSHHAVRMGYDVHVAFLKIKPDSRVLLDENRKTRVTKGMKIHELIVGQVGLPFGQTTLWDGPHDVTITMMYQSLEMLYKEELFDLFHSFYLYPVGYVSGLLAKRFQKPHILTIVGEDVKKYFFSPEKVAICRSSLENANRVVGLSQDLIDMADSLFPIKDKARVILNSVSIPEKAWKPFEKPKYRIKIGVAGFFKYAKGLPYLFKAVSLLRPKYPISLELLGMIKHNEKDLFENFVRELKLGDILTFKETLPHEQVQEWLRTLDIFVLSSLSEGCPNIAMESMANGVPTVATRTGALEELIDDQKSGILVPWGNSEALREAIEMLLEDRDLALSIATNGRRRMKEFSSKNEFDNWQSLYTELL